MLSCLRVHEFAIVESLEVRFEPGFNVITGETGAGKSLLVHALELVLGGRARVEVIRSGAAQAEVEALFDLSGDPAARTRLEALGLEPEDEVVLRRAVLSSGRSLAWINGRLATVAGLRRVAAGLVDISSQHEHQTLADTGTHLAFLDAFARLADQRAALEAAWERLVATRDAVRDLVERERTRADREDLLRFQLAEVEALDPQPGEDTALREETERLRHAERLSGGALRAEAVLYEAEDAVCTRLAREEGRLRDLAGLDPALGLLAEQVAGARRELEEAARALGRYGRDVTSDPERLAEVEQRLDRLHRLSRRFGGSLEALLAWRETARQEFEALEHLGDRLEAARDALETALAEAGGAARRLSAQRREAAERLGAAVTVELADLGMGGARVLVDVAPLEPGQDLEVDGARLTASGIDRVEFLIAPNPGEEPRPLRSVASGGELSRSLLAVKRVLAAVDPVGTYVFDEVDSGVGGAVAESIGRKLQAVARHHQVVCVTHLPQIAACAETHFHVRKAARDGRTRTALLRLEEAERVEELARMLGGITVTEATRTAARELRLLAGTAAPPSGTP